MVRIIYHSSDFDGHCSGAIIKYYYDNFKKKEKYSMLGYNYGNPFSHDEYKRGDELIFADCSYIPLVDFYTWEEKYGYKITLIDHHKSVIESEIAKHVTNSSLTADYSGCELSWKYFFPDIAIPDVVSLLGRYDRWDNKNLDEWEHKILPFQNGFKLLELQPWDKDWVHFFKDDKPSNDLFIENTITAGINILKYQRGINKRLCDRFAEDVHLNGFSVLAINGNTFNSQAFESLWDPKKYHFMMMYAKTKVDYYASLYTTRDDIDCSAIAKEISHNYGGGHSGAAGCNFKKLEIKDGIVYIDPFDKK